MLCVLNVVFTELLKWLTSTAHPLAVIAGIAVVIVVAAGTLRWLMLTFSKQSPAVRRDLIMALLALRGRK